ncbi:MAG: PLP-dependent transferase [Acidobacteriota bacterium]|nr:PLP-dependent transferase [Acidobacteriota bacterium]
MPNRRSFLQGLTSMPVWSALGLTGSVQAAVPKRDYFKELGVKPFINAAGTYTTLTASLMQPEVVEAIAYASRSFVRLDQMQDAASKRIAALLQAEGTVVTSGAAGALTIGTAACVAGENPEFITRLPDTTGMKSEVIVQKAHRYGYDHAVRNCGVKLIEVETAEDLERVVNPKTAMMLFYNNNDPVGKIRAADFVQLGKKHNVPTFNDASADVPPVGNLTKYIRMGFDLVAYSGGKGLCGPQSAGLLVGRGDLIRAARLNTSPYSDSIGRGMKVNKEEILGMMVALENYMKRDHDAEWREWEKRIGIVRDSVANVATLKSEVFVPDIANHVPHVRMKWDSAQLKVSPADVIKQLREGDPSIEVTPAPKDELVIAVWMLQPGEAQIVARKLRAILKNA